MNNDNLAIVEVNGIPVSIDRSVLGSAKAFDCMYRFSKMSKRMTDGGELKSDDIMLIWDFGYVLFGDDQFQNIIESMGDAPFSDVIEFINQAIQMASTNSEDDVKN